MASTDPLEWRLLDTDLTTVLGILPADGSTLYIQLSEPGSGGLRIPLSSTIAASISVGQFCSCHYRGAIRGGFFVENITYDDAKSGENGDAWMTLSGRGPLALLDDAIVWDTGNVDSTRTFSNVTMAGALITLIDEAQTRGCFPTLSYDFSSTLDTDSEAWTDSETPDLTVGKSLLDVMRLFAGRGIDFEMALETDGSFTLHAYLAQGTDKSETIYFRIGQNCQEVGRDEYGSEIKNALRLRYKYGYSFVKDATSISSYRRREELEELEYAGTSSSALTFGQSKLTYAKDPTTQIHVRITDATGPQAFVDYVLGDTIVLDRKGTEADYRIRGLSLSWVEDYAHIEVDLNSTVRENEIRMSQDITRLQEIWTRLTDTGLPIIDFWAAISQPTTGTSVLAIAVDGTDIYVGGVFTEFGGVACNNVAVFHLTTNTWEALGTGLDAGCYALAVNGSDIIAGGAFTDAGGVTVSYIASWDGSSWSDIGGGVNGYVRTIAIDGTDIIAGGNITTMTGYELRRWNGGTWASEGAEIDARVNVAKYNGNGDLYIGGEFVTSGATTLNHVAVQNGAAWDALGTGTVGVDDIVQDLDFVDTDVYVGGEFANAGGAAAAYFAMFDGSAWSEVGGGIDGVVYAVAASLTDVYIAGNFTQAGDIAAASCAKWNGGSFQAMGSGIDDVGYSLALYDYLSVFVGGTYAKAGGKDSPRIALFMTTLQTVLNYLGGGDSGGPGGPDEAIQYNENGRFGGSSNLLYDYTNGNIYFGGLTPPIAGTNAYHHVLEGASPGHGLWAFTSSYAGFVTFFKGNGTSSTPTALLVDEIMGRLRARGYDGTSWATTHAEVRFVTDEGWSVGNHGTRVEIWATPQGSTTLTKSAAFDGVGLQMSRIGTPTYYTLQHMQNVIHSSGWTSGGGITDNGDGTIDVAAGTGLIRATDSDYVDLKFFDWSASAGISLSDGNANWVYVEYNSGSPQITTSTTEPTDLNTNVILAVIYRDGTDLHVNAGVKHTVGNHASLMMRAMAETMPFAHVSGAVVTEVGTLQFSISAGVWWWGLNRFTTAAFDGTSDSFTYYYSDGAGGWTEAASQTAIDDAHYDDGSGTLASVTSNRYSAHWGFLSVEGTVHVLYGTGNYTTLAEAQAALLPSDIPTEFNVDSRFLFKVVVQEGGTSFESLESVLNTTFQVGASGAVDSVNGDTGTVTVDYASVSGADAATNVTAAELEELTDGSETTLHSHADTREVLAANRTYYVRTDGNDSNDGLTDSSGGAFLTLQKAVDVAAALDLSIYDVTIQVGDGTYTAGVSLAAPFVGAGGVTLQGNNSTPANVLVHTTSANCFDVGGAATLTVNDLKVQTTTSGTGLRAYDRGSINFQNIVFYTCADQHMQATGNGILTATGNYSITGNAKRHWFATGGGIINAFSITVTLTGTPAFSSYFVGGSYLGIVFCYSTTFTGGASGTAYNVVFNGVVYINGGSLPSGLTGGSTATGGQYA